MQIRERGAAYVVPRSCFWGIGSTGEEGDGGQGQDHGDDLAG